MKTLIVSAGAGAAVLAGAWGACRRAFASPRGNQNDDYALPPIEQLEAYRDRSYELIRRLNAVPFERVYITSYDGLRLAGRYYAAAPGAPLAICFHGYRGTPSRDFSGGAQLLRELGCGVLLAEQRAHGSSQGRYITMGVRERRDCADWVRWAVERFGPEVRIVLSGISMGAATVLMAVELGLPANVKGVMADCPFTNPRAIVKEVLRGMRAPALYPLLALGSRLFARFGMEEADAARAVRNTALPVLLIHGEDDRLVPCAMSRAIAAADPGAEIHTFPGAGHGISFLTDEARYHRVTADFLSRVLKE